MQIQGKKILLRSVVSSDADILYKWENNTTIWEVSETKKPFTKKEIESFIAKQKDIYLDKQLRLMICTPLMAVGCIDLFEFNTEKAGIGILIAEEYRNKGFASEALSLLIKHCFETLRLESLYCNISEGNVASMKLFKGLEFSITGKNKNEYILQLNSFTTKAQRH